MIKNKSEKRIHNSNKNNQLKRNLLFTKGTHEEVARVKTKGLEIKLIRVEDLLLGKVKI